MITEDFAAPRCASSALATPGASPPISTSPPADIETQEAPIEAGAGYAGDSSSGAVRSRKQDGWLMAAM